MTQFAVVALANLGADFDTTGAQVTGKINMQPATTAAAGKVRLASATDVSSGTAGAVVDAATLKTSIAGLLGNYQGTWNAATNTPQLLSGQGTKGYLYKVSTAGVSIATTASAAVTAAAVIPVASATGIVPGQLLAASGVTGTITVLSVSGSNVTVTGNVTIASGVAVTFSTYLDGAGPFYVGDLVEFDGTTWDKSNSSAETSVSVTDAFGTHLYFAAP
jgi:hypothetical protein